MLVREKVSFSCSVLCTPYSIASKRMPGKQIQQHQSPQIPPKDERRDGLHDPAGIWTLTYFSATHPCPGSKVPWAGPRRRLSRFDLLQLAARHRVPCQWIDSVLGEMKDTCEACKWNRGLDVRHHRPVYSCLLTYWTQKQRRASAEALRYYSIGWRVGAEIIPSTATLYCPIYCHLVVCQYYCYHHCCSSLF